MKRRKKRFEPSKASKVLAICQCKSPVEQEVKQGGGTSYQLDGNKSYPSYGLCQLSYKQSYNMMRHETSFSSLDGLFYKMSISLQTLYGLPNKKSYNVNLSQYIHQQSCSARQELSSSYKGKERDKRKGKQLSSYEAAAIDARRWPMNSLREQEEYVKQVMNRYKPDAPTVDQNSGWELAHLQLLI